MDFYEAVYKRRTVREFLDEPVDFETIRRILEAGNAAPTWNHNRTWSYIVLRTPEEKEFAFPEARAIADKFDADAYLNRPKPYPTTLAQHMYAHAMPRQYGMLAGAPYVVIPVFRCKGLSGEYVSKLNPLSTIWCVVENIFLAATAGGDYSGITGTPTTFTARRSTPSWCAMAARTNSRNRGAGSLGRLLNSG